MKRTEFLSVQFRTCHYNTLGNQLAVDCIPINIFLIPVRTLLLTEQHSQCRYIPFRSDNEQAVTFFNYFFRSGDTDISIPP